MKTEWIKNDWFSTTLILSCGKCGKKIYNDVYTIPMTDSARNEEVKKIMKGLSETCPFCGRNV